MFARRIVRIIWLMALFIALSTLATLQTNNTAAQGLSQQAQVCNQVMAQVGDRIAKSCNALNGDQGCYGNSPLQVEYQSAEAAQQSSFAKPGDMAMLNILKSIHTGPLNTATGEWGVALLKMRAGKLPATVNGQLVTFVVYGDTTLLSSENAPKPEPEVDVCPAVSVRAGSLLTKPVAGSPIVQQIPADLAVEVYTRAPDSKWLFAQFQGKSGWLPVENVRLGCNINSLPTDDPAVPALMSGINAFYFSTAISAQTACQDIPAGGVVIDSPTGRAVTFSANGVNMTMRSAALLQARPNGQMDISVLRGEVELAFQTERRVVTAGNRISIPVGKPGGPTPANLQDALQASGPFSAIRPITFDRDIQGDNGLCQVMRAASLPTDWCSRTTVQSTPRPVVPTATARGQVVLPQRTAPPPTTQAATQRATVGKPTATATWRIVVTLRPITLLPRVTSRVVAPAQPTALPPTKTPLPKLIVTLPKLIITLPTSKPVIR